MSLFPRHMKGDPALAAQRVELVVDVDTELRNLGICLSVFVSTFILSAFLVYRLVQTRVLGMNMTEQEWVVKYRYNGQYYPVPDRLSVSASASADDSHHSVDSPTKKSDFKIMVSPSSPTSTVSSPMSSPTKPSPKTWPRAPVTATMTTTTTNTAASAPAIAPPAVMVRNSTLAAQRQQNMRQRQRVRQTRRRVGVEAVVEEVEEEEMEEEAGDEEEEAKEEKIKETNDVGKEAHSAITPTSPPVQEAETPAPTKIATDIIGADSAIASALRS